MSQELSWIAVRGLTIVGTCNLFDPDLNLTSGTRSRYGLGVEYMPYPFLVLYGVVDAHRFDTGEMVAGSNYTQSEIQIHFLY